MSIDMDMKEIHDIFFEESEEGIDVMESGLLGLEPGNADPELINTIFRAAHSIKGGAATFGFTAISEFTHGVETLLDQLRSNQRAVSEDLIEVLLGAVDCVRGMLAALKDDAELDLNSVTECQEKINALLGSAPVTSAAEPVAGTDEAMAQKPGVKTWDIEFRPDANIFKTGNEPIRIFRELESLGKLNVFAELAEDVEFDSVDPENCYCGWVLELEADVDAEAIEAAFEWVKEQCDLKIHCRNPQADATADTGAVESANTVAQLEPPKSESNAAKPTAAPAAASRDSGSIRVNIDKIDALLNLVGELVITQSMLARFGENGGERGANSGLRDGLMVLERHTRELQESAMQIRMLPISSSFSRFKRLVRDISSKLGKKVELVLSGEDTELDKTVLEKMSDPLVHLVRNSLDHGIEMPEQRLAAGKPEVGTLKLSAYHEGGSIVIEVEDDGAGLNAKRIHQIAIERGVVSETEQLSEEQIHHLIFQPGFSTAEAVSDLSGRGVGMDVVRRNIADLGGRIDIHSEQGKGSCLKIRLPLTLAILDGQLVRVGDDVYIFSLRSIVETVLVPPNQIKRLAGGSVVYRLREDYIPVVRLRERFNLNCSAPRKTYLESDGELMVVVESDGKRLGLFVDELLDQQQVVIKSLEENYMPVTGLAGATILGDGNVAMIIDVPGLVRDAGDAKANDSNAA